MFAILVSCYASICLLSILSSLFEWSFILSYFDLFCSICLCFTSLYFTLFSLVLFFHSYILLYIISLCFALLYALLSSFRFSSAFQFTLFMLRIYLPFRSLYALFYPTLLYFHSTIFPFALHCFVSLHYLTSVCFVLYYRAVFSLFFLVQFPFRF